MAQGHLCYCAIPIYTCDAPDTSAVDWVHSRSKYRYAMWHDPVLYDRRRNVSEMNAKWGLYASAFRVFLFEVIFTSLNGLAKNEGHSTFPLVNGEHLRPSAEPMGVLSSIARKYPKNGGYTNDRHS